MKRTPFKKKPSKPLKRGKIKPVSDKRAKQNKAYLVLREVFLNGKMCAVYPYLKATQVHHMAHREHERLNDIRFWLAVSDSGHKYIHANPEEAREKKWLV